MHVHPETLDTLMRPCKNLLSIPHHLHHPFPIISTAGTPDYMSPQITAAKAQGKALYDGTKADVWAMGVLLCVSLIGKFPFEGDSVSTMGVNDPMKKVRLGCL